MSCQATLPKDCDCVNHDGPHWLHAALSVRADNERIRQEAMSARTPFERRYAVPLYLRWSELERARIRELICELRLAGWGDHDPLPDCLVTVRGEARSR